MTPSPQATHPIAGWEDRISRYHLDSAVAGIDGRAVTVIVPPGYRDGDGRRYPVFVMHDGAQCLDRDPFGHGGWQVHIVASDLVTRGLMAPVLVVLVDNHDRHRTEEFNPGAGTSPGPSAGGYLDFVEQTVLPFVAGRYRVAPGPVAIGGSSYGAIISLHAGWTRPGVYGAVMAMSPAYVTHDFVAFARDAVRPARLRLYLDSGTTDQLGGDDHAARTRALRDLLLERGFTVGHDFSYVVGQGDTHDEAAWRRRLPGALPFLFPPIA